MSAQASEPPSSCEVCGQQFPTKEELHQHKTQVHAGQNPNNNNKQQPTG